MPTNETRALEPITADLRVRFEASNRAREEALRACREIIQFASRTIRAVHRGEMEAARAQADEARIRVDAVGRILAEHGGFAR